MGNSYPSKEVFSFFSLGVLLYMGSGRRVTVGFMTINDLLQLMLLPGCLLRERERERVCPIA
jgi:hypothetical protein